MQKITLYRIIRQDGGISVSPNKPTEWDSVSYRLIADSGKELVKGDVRTYCIDTNNPNEWTEEDEVIKDDYID